ncbi:MAG: hypothetical protein CMP23_04255 [Rickettsiales bacterium]|nr:hypothetical protein [Rickettsiales bacterium]
MRRLLLIGAGVVICLVLLPVLGMVMSAGQPTGLVTPPPVSFSRLLPLIGRTLALALLVSGLSLALGTWLAWATVKSRYLGSRLLAQLGILPLVIPSYLLAAILREELAPRGVLGELLGTQSAFMGFSASVFVLTLCCTPYVQLLVVASLRSLPASEDEAARSLGAGPWRRFTRLAAPRLRPTWAFSLALVALYVVSDFGAVAVLDCEVLTWELYKARGASDAYRIGLGILVCALPLLALIRLLQGQAHPDRHQGAARAASPAPLLRGWPLLLAYLSHLLMIGIGVAIPVASLMGWVLDGIEHQANFAAIGAPLLTTLAYATLGAALVLLAALLPAAASSRLPKHSAWVEHGVFATSSVPGILLAFGILHLVLYLERNLPIAAAGQNLWSWLEGGSVFLLLGYIMRFLSQGYAAAKPAIVQVDTRLVDAARSLGADTLRRIRTVWLPSMAPGMLAAYMLLFIAVAKELPVTLMLLPAGKQTLAYRIFDGQSEASLPDVGLAGLLLLAAALGVQAALSRWRRYAH